MGTSKEHTTDHVYQLCLGIPEEQCPPDHYQLLGLRAFESDPQLIAAAADRRMQLLREQQLGRYRRESQRLLNEVAEARICLLSPDEKIVYDRGLAAIQQALNLSPLPVPLETISPDEIPMRTPEHLRSQKLWADAIPTDAARASAASRAFASTLSFQSWTNWKVVLPAILGVAALIGLVAALLWRLS